VKKKTKKDTSLPSDPQWTRAKASAAQPKSSGLGTGTATVSTAERGQLSKKKERNTTGIGDPFKSISPHKTITVPKVEFVVRQVSFSPNGEWCIACGEHGMIAVMTTWAL
jgi:polycomb protein EED